MKIIALSDLHGNLDRLDAIADELRAADLLLVSGDITKSGSADEAAGIIRTLQEYNAALLAVHGNRDFPEVATALDEAGVGLHARGTIVNGIGFFGAGGGRTTRFHTACEYSEGEILEFLQRGFAAVAGARRVVLLSHTPPKGVRDRMFLGFRAGSAVVRDFISGNRVDLCVCGHIHEARGTERLIDTLVANAGSFRNGWYARIELDRTVTVTIERA